jgi:hypothetical protein
MVWPGRTKTDLKSVQYGQMEINLVNTGNKMSEMKTFTALKLMIKEKALKRH